MRKKKLNFLLIGFWLLAFILYFITSTFTSDYIFTQKIYPNIFFHLKIYYIGIFDSIPFSIGDFLYSFIFIYLLYCLFKFFKYLLKKEFSHSLYEFSKIGLILIYFWIIFQWIWGFNYYKEPLLSEKKNIPTNELKEMAFYHFEKAKKLSSSPLYFKNDNHVKVSLFSYFMRYFGVTGYYNPFTSEAQRVGQVPQVRIPFTVAHEKAHQKGWAREYEANYIGYHDALSGDTASKYSAEYTALNYILGEIYPKDSVFVRNILDNYSKRMKSDRIESLNYYKKYKGLADGVFSELNNFFLKSNNQQEGIKSYNRFVELLHKDYLDRKKNFFIKIK